MKGLEGTSKMSIRGIWISSIIVFLLGLVFIILLLGQDKLERKHEDEISRVISNSGGDVLKIDKVTPENSPFAEDYNKSNVIYKITYKKRDTEFVAWYRGINVVNNIHAKNPTALEGGYGEKWILPPE